MELAGKHRVTVVVSLLSIVSLPAAAGQAAEPEVYRQGGKLRAVAGQEVRSSVPETLKILSVVPAGQRVEKGDLLVELDATPLRESLSEQQVVVSEAELKLKLAEMLLVAAQDEADVAVKLAEQALEVATMELKAYLTGEHPMHKSEAQNMVQMVRQRLAHRRQQLAAQESSENAAAGQVAEARLAVQEAQNELEVAESRLHLIELMHPLQKAQRELAVSEHKLNLMRIKNERKRTVLEQQGDMTLAHERYLRLKEQIEYQKKWVTECKLYAPRAGLLLYGGQDQRRRGGWASLEPGMATPGGAPLVEVVDPGRFEIEIKVAEKIVRRFEKGQEAVVRVDAVPEERFAARVTEIRLVPGRGDYSVVTVQLEDPKGLLRVGMSAKVEITL